MLVYKRILVFHKFRYRVDICFRSVFNSCQLKCEECFQVFIDRALVLKNFHFHHIDIVGNRLQLFTLDVEQ